jgi:hypothetical protein
MTGYEAWGESYSGIFGLTNPGDLLMVAAWEDVFDYAGYTLSELEAAKKSLATHGGVIKREEHLDAIQRWIREQRQEALAREQKAEERYDRGTCIHCGNTGWVIVPHPKQIRDGQWLGTATATVTCSCWMGQRIDKTYRGPREEKPKDMRDLPLPMTLAFYQEHNPGWFQQMQAHEQELTARAHARQVEKETANGRKAERPKMPKSWEGKVQT